ncbi:MAG TPA: type I secretion system permease/ATPase [Stellaceae bacterium]|nr:type I secretion system permease/ATPase [Stellaceae bacterium]
MPRSSPNRRPELSAALASCRLAFAGVALFSAVLNLLYLTGSFYMLEVYDRVLPSRSPATLVGLSLLAALLFAFQGLFDIVRNRILVRIGGRLDDAVNARVFDVLVQLPIKGAAGQGLQPSRDLDQVRSFLSTVGPAALFDLPWIPLYLGICFLFHPWIGTAATTGGLILVAVTLATEVLTRAPAAAAAVLAGNRNAVAEASRRNSEAVHAMGMGGRLGALWRGRNRDYLAAQQRAADIAATLGGLSKVLRLALQSGVLGIGAWLVINQQATAGVIIAGSILTSRALAPIELAIAHWRGFVAARQSWRRLAVVLDQVPPGAARLALPAPVRSLAVEAVSVVPPGASRVVVQDMALQLKAGQGLGIIGPSASGKSSLARAIVGVWTPVRGAIRLDGAALDQWSPQALGRHVGYLPQDMELFAGTVAQNIARFDAQAAPDAVIAASVAAGAHEMILGLPEGYETEIGEAGAALSAGQRQRVGLARALYDAPFLVVLDEPNANLDGEGEEALTRAIQGVRARGGIVIVIAHRPSALAGVDTLLVMAGGRLASFGPKESVLKQALRPAPVPARVAAGAAGAA